MDEIQASCIKIYKDECDNYDEYADMPHAVEEEDENGNEYITFFTISQYDLERINDG